MDIWLIVLSVARSCICVEISRFRPPLGLPPVRYGIRLALKKLLENERVYPRTLNVGVEVDTIFAEFSLGMCGGVY